MLGFPSYKIYVCIYVQLVPSLQLFTINRGRVYTGALQVSCIILLSICTSMIPSSTVMHSSFTQASRVLRLTCKALQRLLEREYKHPIMSPVVLTPSMSTMEGSNISVCNSSLLIPPTSAFSSSINNCLIDCSDFHWRRKCCRVSSEALQSGHTLDT